MECASAFQELASRNPVLQRLVDQGHIVDFIGGHVVVYGVPYLDVYGALHYGDLCTPVDIGENHVIQATGTHQCWWRGGKPHRSGGVALPVSPQPNNTQVAPDFVTDFAFSLKLLDDNKQMRAYASFEEKIKTYLDMIVPPALAAHPGAPLSQGIAQRAAEQGSPLRFPDTASARYGQNDVADKLRGKKVAIVGLGGTGAYILDFIARTHLDNITLFDDDTVHVHTLFRAPGCIDAGLSKLKVNALYQVYDKWHAAITAVPERITPDNIELLAPFDFVFVSVDDGPSRQLIVEWLSARGIAFVDCGMGLERSREGLNAMVRVTGVDREAYERTLGTVYLPTENPKDAEYRRQPQIVEFNALNAALAVIRFKQHFKLYERVVDAAWHLFESSSFSLDRERHPQ
jgi:hypothetical protein